MTADDTASDPFASAPEQATPSTPTADAPAGESPPGAAQESQAPVDTFDGGQFNPDDLPPELQPAWKQLQAAYTRKTQEMADHMRPFEELAGVDPAQLQQASQLLGRIQDPEGWLNLHAELTAALQQHGMMPEEAAAVAEEAVAAEMDMDGMDDPDIAPLVQQINSMRGELDEFRTEREMQQEADQAERIQTALVGELTRQESVIRQNNPDYKETDYDAIYELADHYDGNLFQAQEAYERFVADRVGRYFAAKEGAASAGSVQPAPAGAGVPSSNEEAPESLEAAAAEAEELLRRLVDAGEIDLDF